MLHLVVHLTGDTCGAYPVENEKEAHDLAEIVFEIGDPRGGGCIDCGSPVSGYEPNDVIGACLVHPDGREFVVRPKSA